ncbi:protein RALF-like 34, partial [Neltuma alba]|uniref:protein RALF-like 34 n=1 Tax=Neltuma alba TaxID=207710 RepID=UPI0010A4C36E
LALPLSLFFHGFSSPVLQAYSTGLSRAVSGFEPPCKWRRERTKTSMKLMSDALEWPTTMSLYDELEDAEEDAMDGGFSRRSLYWHRMRYYISYGALSANRIPCPPRSGRSYYTHNCFKARGPVHPYSRGCSAITRCRR